MQNAIPYKSKQFLTLLIKLSIVFGACYFIYNRLHQLNIGTFWEALQLNQILSFKNSCILLGLSALNWFFEVLKWKVITSPVKEISLKMSLEQSLGSLTASLFTPNRIGEYGAKPIYFEKKDRKKIVLITLINNMGQMLVTLFFGLLGISFFIKSFQLTIIYSRLYILIGLLTFISAIIIFILKQKRIKIGGVSLQRIKTFLKTIPRKVITINIALAFLRYLIFSHQFYFLISLFNPQISYLEIMMGITTIYLISSVVPMLFIFDVILKSSIAVWVFGYLNINEFAVITTITLMWMLNFMIPGILGSYFVLNFSFNHPPKVINKS
ncbi:hypothetical protein GTQ40_14615 [Flavobacteriaceae bacterium R38]|nr:hypothetical protein [Flavobacteriaceae bacterium R38]